MPVDYSGTWDIVRNVNFEGYMVALGRCHRFFYNHLKYDGFLSMDFLLYMRNTCMCSGWSRLMLVNVKVSFILN